MGREFTPAEDKIIIGEIRKASINLTVAFERASEQLGDRTASSISKRWYRVLSHREAVFASVSSFGVASNRKNAPRKRVRGELDDEVLELAFPGTSNAQKLVILEQILQRRR